MSEKKQLNLKQLENVTGGGRYITGKYYAALSFRLYQKDSGGRMLGPYDSYQDAKTNAENEAEVYKSAHYNIITIQINYYNENCEWERGTKYNY